MTDERNAATCFACALMVARPMACRMVNVLVNEYFSKQNQFEVIQYETIAA